MPHSIWLVQLLCPARHAIVASPYDPAEWSRAAIETELRERLTRCGVREACGICGATTLHFEHAKTIYTDWATALDGLFAAEAQQILSRAHIDAARKDRN